MYKRKVPEVPIVFNYSPESCVWSLAHRIPMREDCKAVGKPGKLLVSDSPVASFGNGSQRQTSSMADLFRDTRRSAMNAATTMPMALSLRPRRAMSSNGVPRALGWGNKLLRLEHADNKASALLDWQVILPITCIYNHVFSSHIVNEHFSRHGLFWFWGWFL